jgi:glycosyltransferase involved in cell wall biosynthesis
MRIVMLSTPPGRCGVGDYGFDLSNSLRSQGHQADLIEFLRVGDRSPPVRELASRIGDYDAVIVQHEFSFFGDTWKGMFDNFAEILQVLQRSGKPAIAVMHTDMPMIRKRPVLRPWSHAARDRSARRGMLNAINRTNLRLLVHSEDSRRAWIKIGIASERIDSIIFPMRLMHPLVEPRKLSETDRVELVIFGFVAEYKGYEVALKAMRLLPENYFLTIAGDTSEHHPNIPILDAIYGFLHNGEWTSVEHYPHVPSIPRAFTDEERESLRKRVRITGYIPPDEIAAIMRSADIVLLPYRKGPSGSASLGTALSSARPTITTAVDGARNLATQTNCFRMIAIDAPFQLAETIREVAMNLDERRRMFNEARVFAEAHSVDELARKCVEILSELGCYNAISAFSDRGRTAMSLWLELVAPH